MSETWRQPPNGHPRGISSIKAIIALPIIIMFAWIGAEIGLAVRAANGARTAADAIALAAAARVREGFDASVTDALAAAAANRGPNGPVIVEIGAEPVGGGDVEFGRWDEASRSFVPDPDGGPAVRVRVRFAADHPNGAAGLIFARLFGAGLFAIERTSVAIHNPPRHLTSALVVAPDGVGMDLAGAATVVAWGGLSLASEAAIPLRIAGDAEIDAPVVRVRTALDADTVAAISGTVETVEAIAADPFAAVALPPMGAGDPDQIDHDQLGITVVSPGLHAGLSATGGTVVLGPGIHRFAGPILLGGSAVLSLDGATLRLDDGVGMELTGSAGIAGTASGSFSGGMARFGG